MDDFDVNSKSERQNDYELYMAEQAKEEMMEEAKEEETIYNKYYQMLTAEEKFNLAESNFLDDGCNPNWYLEPKLIVEGRRKKANNG